MATVLMMVVNVCNAFTNVRVPRFAVTGYCSKCYREYVQKERERTSATTSVSSDKAEQKSHVGFSKFEEKKRLQSDKKNKYLKNLAPVFRKSSSAKGM